jgi:amino acid transporter
MADRILHKKPTPWWLPTGSIRALMAILIVFAAIYSVFVIVATGAPVPDWFIAIVSSIVTYYFTKDKN